MTDDGRAALASRRNKKPQIRTLVGLNLRFFVAAMAL